MESVPTPKERIEEHLAMAVVGLQAVYGHLQDAENLAHNSITARVWKLAVDLTGWDKDIAWILGGLKEEGAKPGLVEILTTLRAELGK